MSIHSQMGKLRGGQRRARPYEGFLWLLRCIARGRGTSQGIYERFFGPAFALVVEMYTIQSHTTLTHSSSDLPAYSPGI